MRPYFYNSPIEIYRNCVALDSKNLAHVDTGWVQAYLK